MSHAHLTEEEVQRLAGLETEAEANERAAGCEPCRKRIMSARRLDRALRRMGLEQTSPGFTASVMQELELVPGKRSGLWFVESLAAFSALCLVLGVLVTLFALAGVWGEGSDATLPKTEQVWNRVAGQVNSVSATAQEWLTKSIPTVGSGGVEIALLMLSVVAVLGVADRFLGRPLRHPVRR